LSSDADLILHNASVITLDRTTPRATAVAVRGNRILDAGANDAIEPLRGPKTEVIDCQGKTVLPGFNDAHCHPLALAASLMSVDCRPPSVGSISDIQNLIRQQAARVKRGTWIRATGYNEFYLTEKRHPNRWDMDRAAPDHPVKLSHRTGHACVLNSLALRLLEISPETPEPPGGIIDRDLETGDPNGLLFEMNTYVERLIPPLSDEELGAGMRLANEQFISHGITSVQDATWSNSLKRWETLHRFKSRGELSPRLSMMIGIDELEELEANESFDKSSMTPELRPGAVKIVLHTTTGSLVPRQEDLNQLVYKAHALGYQVALHADDQSTVEAAITALEHALSRIPRPGHRHRIEHCSVCSPRLMQRLKRINAVVVTQPPFVYYSGERYLATVPPDELRCLYPIGSLCASGLTVAGSSDTPVVSLNPLAGIYAAVTRTTEPGQSLLPEEGISSSEALKLYTLNAAYASFEENIKGSITGNKLADLVILNDDPTEVPPEEIRTIEVAMTVIDGKIVWQRQING
jgi:predicted amidohydrolase YtcJ